MRLSHSRVNTFVKCPYKYKLSYIDGLKTRFNLDPTNALALGTAMHEGIEKDVKSAIGSYYSNYPTATPLMVNEAIKLEIMVEKAKAVLPVGEYETEIGDDDFIGFIDLLVPVDDDTFDMYDFKYSNNVANYLESSQLHLYKYLFEKLNPGKTIRNMAFVFIPKVKLKQEEDEDISDYRKRLIAECNRQEINIVPIDYNPNKVIEFMVDAKHCIECEDYEKNKSGLCWFCDFKTYCNSNGENDGNIIYPDKEE